MLVFREHTARPIGRLPQRAATKRVRLGAIFVALLICSCGIPAEEELQAQEGKGETTGKPGTVVWSKDTILSFCTQAPSSAEHKYECKYAKSAGDKYKLFQWLGWGERSPSVKVYSSITKTQAMVGYHSKLAGADFVAKAVLAKTYSCDLGASQCMVADVVLKIVEGKPKVSGKPAPVTGKKAFVAPVAPGKTMPRVAPPGQLQPKPVTVGPWAIAATILIADSALAEWEVYDGRVVTEPIALPQPKPAPKTTPPRPKLDSDENCPARYPNKFPEDFTQATGSKLTLEWSSSTNSYRYYYNGAKRWSAAGRMAYVVQDGITRVEPDKEHKGGHTNLGRGLPVNYAGNINFSQKGALLCWDNGSGHYQPEARCFTNATELKPYGGILPVEKFCPMICLARDPRGYCTKIDPILSGCPHSGGCAFTFTTKD